MSDYSDLIGDPEMGGEQVRAIPVTVNVVRGQISGVAEGAPSQPFDCVVFDTTQEQLLIVEEGERVSNMQTFVAERPFVVSDEKSQTQSEYLRRENGEVFKVVARQSLPGQNVFVGIGAYLRFEP